MKANIHPQYAEAQVSCACGHSFKTRSTKPVIKLEMCSNCHPFYTGKQRLVDTAGRVEKFHKRFAKTEGKTVIVKKVTPKLSIKKVKSKILSTSPKRMKLLTPKDAKKEVKKESKKEK